jgi:hypothetical protein
MYQGSLSSLTSTFFIVGLYQWYKGPISGFDLNTNGDVEDHGDEFLC